MTTATSLSEASILDAIAAADAGAELRLYDAKVPGLLLWRRPNGEPRWYVFVRAGGKMRRAPVGDKSLWPALPLAKARELGRKVVVALASGEDIVKAKRAKRAQARGGAVPTADALTHHLAAMKERGRSDQHTKELERIVKLAIAAGMKDLADPGIAAKAARWLDAMDVSDLTRHRYRVHLIAVGKTAVRWWPADVLPREPFLALSGQGAQMPPPPVFQPAEACTLVSDASLAKSATGGRLWAFLIYTGCRYKEAAWARWDRLDLGRGTFGIIPPDAAEHAAGSRVKRNKSRTVSIQAELVEILTAWPGKHEGFLFSDEWRMRPHVYNVAAFRAHLEALEIPLKERRIHALRHTHACLAIAAGEDSLRLRLSMGHAGEAMQGHYASQAMRWRGQLAEWDGNFRLRDKAEVERLTGGASGEAAAS